MHRNSTQRQFCVRVPVRDGFDNLTAQQRNEQQRLAATNVSNTSDY